MNPVSEPPEIQLFPLKASDSDGVFKLWSDWEAVQFTNWPYLSSPSGSLSPLWRAGFCLSNPCTPATQIGSRSYKDLSGCARIRTLECWNQNPETYHLSTPHHTEVVWIIAFGCNLHGKTVRGKLKVSLETWLFSANDSLPGRLMMTTEIFANLGPLAPLVGIWEGDKGLMWRRPTIAALKIIFIGRMVFEPVGGE